MTNPPIGPVLVHYGWDGRQWGYGEWVTIQCPFHGDTHASGRLNEAEGVFKCHACPVQGNAVKVIEIHEGVDYGEAKRRVQGITGVSVGSVSSGTGQRLASSKLPQWTRDKRLGGKRLSAGRGRRNGS